jgi:hypothetical protein
MPATTPFAEPIDARVELLDVHTPPATVFPIVIVDPAHTALAPDIAAGLAFTVTVTILSHPAAVVYVIIAVPGATPDITPVVPAVVATVSSDDDHVPPVIEFSSVVVLLEHKPVAPVITAVRFTVTASIDLQPVGSE